MLSGLLAGVKWHLGLHKETARPRPGPDAVSAGGSGADRSPALLHLDQGVLYKVLAKLEPEALAVAGAQKHSLYQRSSVCAGASET